MPAINSQLSTLNFPRTCHAATLNSQPSTSHYLRRGLRVWELNFKGKYAILKHELGLEYVAYLLRHPNEPIHGLALALKVRALRNGQSASSADLIQERALSLDDAEAARRIFLKQRELESIVDDDGQSDPVKEEALRELEAIYAFQKKSTFRTSSVANRAAHAVAMALKRLHQRLAKSVHADGSPNQCLRDFADHIRLHILIPSGRAIGNGGVRANLGRGGHFTCELPNGTNWSA